MPKKRKNRTKKVSKTKQKKIKKQDEKPEKETEAKKIPEKESELEEQIEDEVISNEQFREFLQPFLGSTAPVLERTIRQEENLEQAIANIQPGQSQERERETNYTTTDSEYMTTTGREREEETTYNETSQNYVGRDEREPIREPEMEFDVKKDRKKTATEMEKGAFARERNDRKYITRETKERDYYQYQT